MIVTKYEPQVAYQVFVDGHGLGDAATLAERRGKIVAGRQRVKVIFSEDSTLDSQQLSVRSNRFFETSRLAEPIGMTAQYCKSIGMVFAEDSTLDSQQLSVRSNRLT